MMLADDIDETTRGRDGESGDGAGRQGRWRERRSSTPQSRSKLIEIRSWFLRHRDNESRLFDAATGRQQGWVLTVYGLVDASFTSRSRGSRLHECTRKRKSALETWREEERKRKGEKKRSWISSRLRGEQAIASSQLGDSSMAMGNRRLNGS